MKVIQINIAEESNKLYSLITSILSNKSYNKYLTKKNFTNIQEGITHKLICLDIQKKRITNHIDKAISQFNIISKGGGSAIYGLNNRYSNEMQNDIDTILYQSYTCLSYMIRLCGRIVLGKDLTHGIGEFKKEILTKGINNDLNLIFEKQDDVISDFIKYRTHLTHYGKLLYGQHIEVLIRKGRIERVGFNLDAFGIHKSKDIDLKRRITRLVGSLNSLSLDIYKRCYQELTSI